MYLFFLFQVRAEIQAQLKGDKIRDVLAQLKGCPAGLDPALSRSISFGVAYHHAGLTFDERDIVEGIYFFQLSCMFLNPYYFSNLNSNCSNVINMRNLQEQVKKALCYQKLF